MIMNIGLADEINDEFAIYFRSKGFKVIWDFNRLEKVYWYEIYLDDDLCCQVEPLGGVPVKDFLEDIVLLAYGKDGTSKTDFDVRGTDEGLIKLVKYLEGQ